MTSCLSLQITLKRPQDCCYHVHHCSSRIKAANARLSFQLQAKVLHVLLLTLLYHYRSMPELWQARYSASCYHGSFRLKCYRSVANIIMSLQIHAGAAAGRYYSIMLSWQLQAKLLHVPLTVCFLHSFVLRLLHAC